MLFSQNILNKIILQSIGFIHVFLVFFLGGSTLIAKDRLKLKSADLLERKTINGKPTKLISGNVIFTKGALTLQCNNGIHFERSGDSCPLENKHYSNRTYSGFRRME